MNILKKTYLLVFDKYTDWVLERKCFAKFDMVDGKTVISWVDEYSRTNKVDGTKETKLFNAFPKN